MRKYLCLGVATAVIFSSSHTLYAKEAENWIIEGKTSVVKTDEGVNINPYNLASLKGVGENGTVKIVDTYETFDITLDKPLYRLSENYRDRILLKDGVWGVERMVELKTFDGNENWKLLESPGYLNNNTTIFVCDNESPAVVWDGLSTHFDVFLRDAQKNNIYDGISFGRDTNEIYMRIMNVRNVKTVEQLKVYLKAQFDANTPVKFLFAKKEPVFEPLSDEVQQKMNNADFKTLGFIDNNLDKISSKPEIKPNSIFLDAKTGDDDLDKFMSAVLDLKIYADTNASYYLEGIYPTEGGFSVVIIDNNENKYVGEIICAKTSFITEKPFELILKDKDELNSIKMLLNMSKINCFVSETSEKVPINPDCIVKGELVLPKYVAVTKGDDRPLFLENSVLYDEASADTITNTDDDTLQFDNLVLSTKNVADNATARFKLNGFYDMPIVTVPQNSAVEQEATVLFLGDSIINQNLYTKAVSERFKDDDLQLKLIGTAGTEDNPHEGRGGWAAYDYCNTQSKFGYSNPFLNNGSFDFGYYMEQNEYEKLDSVVINLGINDLNLIDHNSHKEILNYFDIIINSIHQYNSEINILINAPTMLFAEDKTQTAKYQRLEFTKSLNTAFEGREKENIFIIPAYLSINPRLGFKQIEPVIDEFNQDRALVVTDTTHPNVLGYQALADMTYSYLKLAHND